MRDIVERLRDDDGVANPTFGDLNEAADEIERLRKIEAAACAVTSSPLWTGEDFDELLWALDAALKEG